MRRRLRAIGVNPKFRLRPTPTRTAVRTCARSTGRPLQAVFREADLRRLGSRLLGARLGRGSGWVATTSPRTQRLRHAICRATTHPRCSSFGSRLFDIPSPYGFSCVAVAPINSLEQKKCSREEPICRQEADQGRMSSGLPNAFSRSLPMWIRPVRHHRTAAARALLPLRDVQTCDWWPLRSPRVGRA